MPSKGLSAVPNGIARLLGSTVRSLEKEFQYVCSPRKCTTAQPVRKVSVTAAPVVAAPVVRDVPVKRFTALTPEPSTIAPRAVKVAAPIIPEIVAAPAVHPTVAVEAPVVRRVEPAYVPVYKPEPAAVVPPPPVAVVEEKTFVSAVKPPEDTLLQGIPFESKSEQVKAEIYFRDVRSANKTQRMDALREIKNLSHATMLTGLERLLAREKDTLQTIEILNALAGLGPKQLFVDYTGHSDAGVRLAALRAISKYNDEESFSILSSFMKDKDPEVRRQMLNCLCWSFGERCLPFALKALHDSNAEVRKSACHIVGTLKTQLAISTLISLLSDPQTDVQESASVALKKITKQDFDFKVNGSKKEKDDAVEGWRYWWRENQTNFERVKMDIKIQRG